MPVAAQAAATFAGSMTVSSRGQNASASRGEIEFVTSADGTAIVSLSYTLHDQECSYVSGSSSTTITSGSSESTLHPAEPIPITNGQFVLDFMGVRATGSLNSPSEGSGQITIEKEESISSPSLQRFTCDYGTWNWNANVQ
jgi:hypothetical protein